MEQIRVLVRKRVKNVLKPLILRELVSDVWSWKVLLIMIVFPVVILNIEAFGYNKKEDLGKSSFHADPFCLEPHNNKETFPAIEVRSFWV